GPAGGAAPGDDGLALVGDPDGVGPPVVVDDLGADRLRGGPDLLGVVLDPARSREVLGELPMGVPERGAVAGEGERTHAGGAGIDGQDVGSELVVGHGAGNLLRVGSAR